MEIKEVYIAGEACGREDRFEVRIRDDEGDLYEYKDNQNVLIIDINTRKNQADKPGLQIHVVFHGGDHSKPGLVNISDVHYLLGSKFSATMVCDK